MQRKSNSFFYTAILIFLFESILLPAPLGAKQTDKQNMKEDSSSIEAWDLYYDKKFDEAIDLFEKDAINHPDWCDPHDGLGWSYLQKGDFLNAEQNFKKCLDLYPYYGNSLSGMTEVNAWKYRRFNRAWEHYYAGNYPKAVEIFNGILADKTNRLPAAEYWRVHSGLGWSLYHMKNHDDAIKYFNEVLGLQKDNTDAIKGIGLCYFEKGDLDQSLKFLNKALSLHSLQPDVQSTIAWIYNRKGDSQKALEEFEKAHQLNPYLAEPYKGLAWTHFDLKDYEKSKQYFLTAINIYPFVADKQFKEILKIRQDWSDLYHVLGWSYYNKGYYLLSKETFEEALNNTSENSELLRGLGYALYKLGEFDLAIKNFKQSLALNASLAPVGEYVTIPGTIASYYINSDAQSSLAWSYYNKNNYEEAIEAFQESIRKHPQWIDAHDGLGWALFMKKDYHSAKKAFKEALAIDPSYADALNGLTAINQAEFGKTDLGWSYYYRGDYLSALQQFEYDLSLDKSSLSKDKVLSLRTGIGWSQLSLGKLNKAEQEFRDILKTNTTNADALLGLGTVLYQRENFSEASEILRQVIDRQPENYNGLASLAWCYYKTKDYTRATETFQKAIKVNPYLVDPYYGLGLSQFYSNDLASAKTSFSSAIDIYPDYVMTKEFQQILESHKDWTTDLYARLGWSYYYKGLYDKASDMFRSVLEKSPTSESASLGLGSIYYQQGDYKGAIDRLEPLLAGKPQEEKGWLKWSVVLNNLGWSYFYTGKYDKAQNHFKELLSLHSNEDIYAEPYAGIGWCLLRLGDQIGAKEKFHKAIELIPGYISALNGLAEIDKEGYVYVSQSDSKKR
jgi:tetratricopeptide (TPR) repeat protein